MVAAATLSLHMHTHTAADPLILLLVALLAVHCLKGTGPRKIPSLCSVLFRTPIIRTTLLVAAVSTSAFAAAQS